MIFNKIKFGYKEKIYALILTLLLFLVINFSRLNIGTYNLEWYFVELSKYFNNKNYFFDIFLFKQNQANTTFYSFILSFFNYSEDLYYHNIILFRIFNFVPFTILFLYIYKNINLDFEKKSILLLLILFCPIITVYSFRIYPDFLSASFSWLSLILLINKNKNLSIIFFSISFLIKPVSIILSPLFIFITNDLYKNERKNVILKFIFFNIVSYILYLLLVEKIIFGSYYETTYLKINPLNIFLNFFYYYNYSILLILPVISYLFFENLKKKITYNIFLVIFASTLLSTVLFYFSFKNGEMNYGYINKLLKNNIFLFILVFINTFLSIIFFNISIKSKKTKKPFLYFLISILFLAILISRPTQRYLIYLLPLLFIIVIEHYYYKKILLRISIVFYMIIFSLITFGQKLIQEKYYKSADKIIIFIDDNKLFDNTNPGKIYHSHGYLFKKFLNFEIKKKKQLNYRYKIDNCYTNENIIIKKNINILNRNFKNICLVEKY